MRPDASAGRFVAALSGHALLDAVAEIARQAAAEPELASGISKRRFDLTRRALGRTDVPSADTIRQRLRRPWDQVLRAALAPAAERGHVLGQGHSRESEFVGPEALALAGLRSVAHALGGPPSSDAYDAELSRRARERARRGLAPLLLPSAATLIGRFGSGQRALVAAGLDAGQLAARAGQRTNRAPAAEQTLSALVDLIGVLPSLTYLERYCQAHSIPLGRDARPYAQLVERVRALRAGQGKPTPDTITPPRQCPPFPGPIAGAPRRPRAKGRPRAAILASLARYGERHLAPGQRPTERHYRACRELDPDLISPSSFPAGEAFRTSAARRGCSHGHARTKPGAARAPGPHAGRTASVAPDDALAGGRAAQCDPLLRRGRLLLPADPDLDGQGDGAAVAPAAGGHQDRARVGA